MVDSGGLRAGTGGSSSSATAAGTNGLNGAKSGHVSAVQRLREMIADPEKIVVCPGVYDGYTARIALREGVDCLYMVGSLIFIV